MTLMTLRKTDTLRNNLSSTVLLNATKTKFFQSTKLEETVFHYSTTIHRIQYAVRAKGLTFVEFENKLGVKRYGLKGLEFEPPKISTSVHHSFG